jgi:serine phosphatase RsbU (regulator of sigma subunit)
MNVEFDRLLPDVEPDSTLYVADEKLRVVYTNDEWRRFAERNEGVDLVGPEKHASLIDNLSGAVQERWAAIYELLLDGSLSHYEEDFICSSPEERRIYRLRVTPTAKDEGEGTWLVHHAVRIDDKAEEREELRRRLRELEVDPAHVGREYRSRIADPRIEIPGFRVARYLEPLGDVGGDVLWHRPYEGGTTDLVIADAMGHGLEAGIHAAKMAMMLDALAEPNRAPQDILASLNRGMLRHRPRHESAYATGIHFRFQSGSTRLRCANFGHMGPIFSRSGQVHLRVGLPVGMLDTIPLWPETELDLEEHGTRFLVFSDGITEQFDAAGEMYGTERLLAVFRDSLDLELEKQLERIVADLAAFRGEALVKDDQTLFAMEPPG